jgi:hypothetical protein
MTEPRITSGVARRRSTIDVSGLEAQLFSATTAFSLQKGEGEGPRWGAFCKPSRKRPFMSAICPVGAYDELMRMPVSFAQTSRWARSGNRPSCQLWIPTTLRN